MTQTSNPNPAYGTLAYEFPDFGELDVELPPNFIAECWHNDAMPKFSRPIRGGRLLTLWIDYKEREKSECDRGVKGKYKRFCLQIEEHEGGSSTDLLLTSTYSEIPTYLKARYPCS